MYKTGNTMSMKRHKQSKLGVVAKWKNTFFEDGKERGMLVQGEFGEHALS